MFPANAVYLIDASVFIFRAYHSVPISLTDAEGYPVNALHGFGRFLGDLIEQMRPSHIAVAFDESLRQSFRSKLYPPYKAYREPAPAELRRQMALCRQLCAALGIAHFASTEYEADDIIGTLAYKMRTQGKCAVIVTRDKDLAQLIGPEDHYWDYIGETRYAYAQIAQRFGVHPERIADFLALTGDAVDNVPGVPGIGKKTATTLVHHFASLEDLYENIDRVLKLKLRNPGFVAGQLRDYRESLFLARRLTGIACDMQLDVSLESLTCHAPQLDVLNAFYDSVGFGRLLRNQAERIVEKYRSPPNAVAA